MNDVNLHDEELLHTFLVLESLLRILKFYNEMSSEETYQKTLNVLDKLQFEYGLMNSGQDSQRQIFIDKGFNMSNLTGIANVQEIPELKLDHVKECKLVELVAKFRELTPPQLKDIYLGKRPAASDSSKV